MERLNLGFVSTDYVHPRLVSDGLHQPKARLDLFEGFKRLDETSPHFDGLGESLDERFGMDVPHPRRVELGVNPSDEPTSPEGREARDLNDNRSAD